MHQIAWFWTPKLKNPPTVGGGTPPSPLLGRFAPSPLLYNYFQCFSLTLIFMPAYVLSFAGFLCFISSATRSAQMPCPMASWRLTSVSHDSSLCRGTPPGQPVPRQHRWVTSQLSPCKFYSLFICIQPVRGKAHARFKAIVQYWWIFMNFHLSKSAAFSLQTPENNLKYP